MHGETIVTWYKSYMSVWSSLRQEQKKTFGYFGQIHTDGSKINDDLFFVLRYQDSRQIFLEFPRNEDLTTTEWPYGWHIPLDTNRTESYKKMCSPKTYFCISSRDAPQQITKSKEKQKKKRYREWLSDD